jgi:hypothetical protein
MTPAQCISEAVRRISERQRRDYPGLLGNGVVARRTQIDADAMEAPPQRTDFDRLAQAARDRRSGIRPTTPAEEAGIARTIINQRGTDAAERIAAHLAALVAQARAEGGGGE